MGTTKVKDYAAAHGLRLSVLLDFLSEHLDENVTPARALDDKVLDYARDYIAEVAIDDLRDAKEAMDYARIDAADILRTAEGNLRRSVREALKEGMPATRVAQVLGVSRARVYQIRDGKR